MATHLIGENKERKRPVYWPTAAARKEWESSDREVDQVLEAVLAGDIGRKVEALSTIIWTMGADRFGMEQGKVKGLQQAGENRRSKEIAKIRGDMRGLREAFLQVPDGEKTSSKRKTGQPKGVCKDLACLYTRVLECHRRDRRRQEKGRAKFTKKKTANICQGFWESKDQEN